MQLSLLEAPTTPDLTTLVEDHLAAYKTTAAARMEYLRAVDRTARSNYYRSKGHTSATDVAECCRATLGARRNYAEAKHTEAQIYNAIMEAT